MLLIDVHTAQHEPPSFCHGNQVTDNSCRGCKGPYVSDEKKNLVLGASSGIGKATAERFARDGWQVLLTGTESDQCETVLASLPGEGHQAYIRDVRNPLHIQQLARRVEQEEGPLDALINSIGISQSVPLIDSRMTAYRLLVLMPPVLM